MTRQKTAKVFTNGRNRAVRIPREFEVVGEEVTIYQESGRLILEPIKAGGFLSLLESMEPIDVPFPDVDDDLLPLDSVDI